MPPNGSVIVRKLNRIVRVGVCATALVLSACGAEVATSPSELPTSDLASSPSAASAPASESFGHPELAESFVVPFEYRIPVDSEIRLDDQVSSDHVHVFSGPGETGAFVVWAVEETFVDPCEPAGERVVLDGGADSLVAYIGSIDQIRIVRQTEEEVDGYSAAVLEVAANTGSGCPDAVVSLWPDSATPSMTSMSVAEAGSATLRIFDVGETTIALETFSGPGDDGTWAAVVAELIGSLHFVAAD